MNTASEPLAKAVTWIDEYGVAWYGRKDGNDIPADRKREAARNGIAGMPHPSPPRPLNGRPFRVVPKPFKKPRHWIDENGSVLYGRRDGNDEGEQEHGMPEHRRKMLLGALAGFLIAGSYSGTRGPAVGFEDDPGDGTFDGGDGGDAGF